MKRRKFVSLVGVGSVAVPLAIASCAPQAQEGAASSETSATSSDGFQAIGTVSELNAKGQLLAEKTAVGSVLVISDPANSSQVLAVNAACTHKGCIVAWQKEQNAFVCPCHTAKFAGDGKVLQGPAEKPLPAYIAKVEGDSVLVKIS